MKIEHDWDKGIHVWDMGLYSVGVIRQHRGGYFWGVMRRTNRVMVERQRGSGIDRSVITPCRRLRQAEGWTMIRTGSDDSYVMAIDSAIAAAYMATLREGKKDFTAIMSIMSRQRIAVA